MIALVEGRLVDGISATPLARGTLLMEGGQIKAAGPSISIQVPPSADIINVSGMTVLPGLMDLHVHLCAAPAGGPGSERPTQSVPETELVLWGAKHAAACIDAGFTTVRDAFSFHGHTATLSLRQATQSGLASGPRILAAGYAGMTASIVDMRFPPDMPRPYGHTADGPWELRKRTREVIRDGYDWVKTFTSGGRNPGKQEEDIWYTNHTRQELEAIIDEAHNFGIKVMIHATTREAIKLAVRCGVDTIEHGWPLDDELIQMMIDRRTYLVPTISVYSERGFLRKSVPEPLRVRAERQYEARMSSFQAAYAAGVRIANGSDIAPSLPTMRHGQNAFELVCMVRQGMKPMDAIRSATSQAAAALGLDRNVGSLREGMAADVLVVQGDPVEDINKLETSVNYVFKDGIRLVDKVAKRPEEVRV